MSYDFPKQHLTLDSKFTSGGLKHMIPRQFVRTYSNYEVFRCKSRSTYLNRIVL